MSSRAQNHARARSRFFEWETCSRLLCLSRFLPKTGVHFLGKRSRQGEAGFTLLELLVVLAIMSLLILAVPRLIPSSRQGLDARAAAYELAGALRAARADALSANTETRLILASERTSYRTEPKGQTHILKPGLTIMIDGALGAGGLEGGILRFYPDGSSSGGLFTVAAASGQAHHVAVRALSGAVRIDE